jgi:uncharacterized protein (DUF1499 family)
MFSLGNRGKATSVTSARKESLQLKEMYDAEGDEMRESGHINRTKSNIKPTNVFWVFTGTLFFVLGLIHASLSFQWSYWIGVATGLSLAKTGTSFIGLGMADQSVASWFVVMPSDSWFVRVFKRLLTKLISLGSSGLKTIFYTFRWPLFVMGIYVGICVAIHIASPDHPVSNFPAKGCPKSKRLGCNAMEEVFNMPVETARSKATEWIQEQSFSTILISDDDRGFIHARMLSTFFGFADDLFLQILPENDSASHIKLQGQLRIGKSDLGVNRRRNKRIIRYLHSQETGRVSHGQTPF